MPQACYLLFGTGYSSLSLVKSFPIDTIKIDRCFVGGVSESVQDRAISAAIITLGKALGLTVVAEGVETAQQDAILKDFKCHEFQGFLFSRPVSADGISRLLGASDSRIEQVASPSILARCSDDVERPRVIREQDSCNPNVAAIDRGITNSLIKFGAVRRT